MYKLKENNKPHQDDGSNKKKTLKIVLIISSILFVILLVLLIIWLWFRNNNQPNTPNKVKYNNSYDASLITDTSSLDNKSFTIESNSSEFTQL